MNEKEVQLNTPLTKDDIELRIGTTSEKGFSLLIYKTARTDIKRLIDVFGDLWKNRHFYDDKNLLCCEISIWNEDIKKWVGRSDVGTESMTEKEKGSYSDSFKRAGFRWGIGLELYRSPFVWIFWDMKKSASGKGYTPVNFYASNLVITDYQVKDGVPYLTIKYQNKAIYSNLGAEIKRSKNDSKLMTAEQKKQIEDGVQYLPAIEQGKLNGWLKKEHTSQEAEKTLSRMNSVIDEHA